jgi:hydroxylamine reductase (hybrid-cluster protein)
MGVCGKIPDVAALQDLLIHTGKGLSQVAVEGRKHGIVDHDVNLYKLKNSFYSLSGDHLTLLILLQQSTLTNWYIEKTLLWLSLEITLENIRLIVL